MQRRYQVLLLGCALWLAWVALRPSQSLGGAAPAYTAPTPSSVPAATVERQPLPPRLERAALESSRRDPFAPAAPPAPPVAAQPASLPVPLPSVAPPQAPPLNLRFAGRATAPDGRETVYVSYGETSMTLAVGQVLPNGYRVDAITQSAVTLSYPPLSTTTQLELPTPPRHEIR